MGRSAQRLAAKLVFIVLAANSFQPSAAQCNTTACSQCTVTECSNTPGCVDESSGDYDPDHCVAAAPAGAGGGRKFNPVVASWGLGLLGGAALCVLPCCLVCRYRIQRETRRWISGQAATRRARATVKRMWTTTSSNEQGGSSTSHHLDVEFIATDASDTHFRVRAERSVYSKTYDHATEGSSNLEVIYKVADVGVFDLVAELELRLSRGTPFMWVGLALAGLFAVVGLAVGVASAPVTDNYAGIFILACMALASPVLGYMLYPMMRHMKVNGVTITPVDPEAV